MTTTIGAAARAVSMETLWHRLVSGRQRRRDSDFDDSDDSNHNRRHPGFDSRHRDASPPDVRCAERFVQIGLVSCPLGGTAGGRPADVGGAQGTSVIPDVSSPLPNCVADGARCQGMPPSRAT